MFLFPLLVISGALAGVCPSSAIWQLQSSWNAGSVVSITLNPSSSCVLRAWSISFAVPSGLTLTNIWSSSLSPISTAATWNISGPAWQLDLTSGLNFGFQVAGSTPFAAPVSYEVASTCGTAHCQFQNPSTTAATLRTTTKTLVQTTARTTTATTTTATLRPTSTANPATTTTASSSSSSSSSTSSSTSAPPLAMFDRSVGSSFARYSEFISKITALQNNGQYRSVLWNGVGGGVVSEGQGYGLLMSGIVLASMSPSDANFAWVVARAVELYQGWRQMCLATSGSNACQSGGMYCSGGTSLCLPHWQFDDTLTVVRGTGSATDGDEDAALGMILISRATEGNSGQYAWWSALTDQAYQTCRAFFDFETGQGLPKLGSCWGGWSCSNPSYLAPAAYRACRDFMVRRSAQQGAAYAAGWNSVIANSVAVLQGAQCPATGLVPNWYIPASSAQPSQPGTTLSSCSSGTPPAEFGSEASRAMWRMTADYLLYGTAESLAFARRAALETISKSTASYSNWLNLDTGCLVQSIFASWSQNGFIFAPLFTTLTVPTGAANQTTVLSGAAQKIAATPITQYYAGAWLTISTLTINGDLQKAAALLKSM